MIGVTGRGVRSRRATPETSKPPGPIQINSSGQAVGSRTGYPLPAANKPKGKTALNLLDLETEVREELNKLMADEDPNLDLMLADVQLLIVLRQIRESEMYTGSAIQAPKE